MWWVVLLRGCEEWRRLRGERWRERKEGGRLHGYGVEWMRRAGREGEVVYRLPWCFALMIAFNCVFFSILFFVEASSCEIWLVERYLTMLPSSPYVQQHVQRR